MAEIKVQQENILREQITICFFRFSLSSINMITDPLIKLLSREVFGKHVLTWVYECLNDRFRQRTLKFLT
jgi:hypothetical protein